MKNPINALTSGDFDALPKDFGLASAKALWLKDKITEEQFDKFIDHLASARKPERRSADLRFKVGEKNWISLSGGYLGVAYQRPVTMKANTLLTLLTHHRDEILESLKEAMEGDYDIQTRDGEKGSYNVLLKGTVVVGSANDKAQIEKQKGILDHCLSMVS